MTTRKHANKKASEPQAAGPVAAAPEAVSELPVQLPPDSLTPDAIEELKLQAAKAAENWDKFLRTTADFENYKKRAARERQEAESNASARLLLKLIPVLDSFEMALAATAAATDPAAKSLQAGVNMIAQQFRSTLADAGLEEIDAAGKPFDPNFHEAVSQHETAEMPEGQVVQQLRKGYRLRDRLLRPASVVVAKKPAAPSELAATGAETKS